MSASELFEEKIIDYFQNTIGIHSKHWSSNIKYLYLQKSISNHVINLFSKYDIPFYKENIDDTSIKFIYLQHYDYNDENKFQYYQKFFNELFFLTNDYEIEATGSLGRNTRKEDILQFPILSNIMYDYIIFELSNMEIINRIINDKYNLVADFKKFQLDNNNFAYFLIKNDWFREFENTTYNIIRLLNSCNISYLIVSDSHAKINIRNEYKNTDNNTHYAHYYRIDLKMPFRSSWEANIARIFNCKNITWKYEYGSFERHDIKDNNIIIGYYFPDFFIEPNTIIEVKGFWDAESRNKAQEFIKYYTDYIFFVIDKDMYYNLKLKYQSLIPEWEEDGITNIDSETLQIVGISFGDRKQTVKSLKIGQSLVLKRDMNNKFDSNAILVLTESNFEIGFISADWAVIYAPKIDLGMTFDAEIKSIEPKIIHIKVKRNNIQEEIIYDFLK